MKKTALPQCVLLIYGFLFEQKVAGYRAEKYYERRQKDKKKVREKGGERRLKNAPIEEGETLQRMGLAGKGHLQECLEKICG